MKQLTSYNRVAGYLNKLFDLLNQRFFENKLYSLFHLLSSFIAKG